MAVARAYRVGLRLEPGSALTVKLVYQIDAESAGRAAVWWATGEPRQEGARIIWTEWRDTGRVVVSEPQLPWRADRGDGEALYFQAVSREAAERVARRAFGERWAPGVTVQRTHELNVLRRTPAPVLVEACVMLFGGLSSNRMRHMCPGLWHFDKRTRQDNMPKYFRQPIRAENWLVRLRRELSWAILATTLDPALGPDPNRPVPAFRSNTGRRGPSCLGRLQQLEEAANRIRGSRKRGLLAVRKTSTSTPPSPASS